MNWDLFWAYKDTAAAKGGKGFAVFSLPHILWLILLAAAIALFTAVYRRSGDVRRDNMRKGLALFLILFEIFKQCVSPFAGVPNGNYLPLEICSFAEYTILISALWPKTRFLGQLLAFAFLPAGIIALLFPTVTVYPPISFFAIHQFVMHAGIVAFILARLVAGEIRPRYAGIWLTVLMVVILILPVYAFDTAFERNYMFLTYHSNNPVLKLIWDLSGGNGGILYIFGLAVFVVIVMHITYVFYSIPRMIAGGRNAAARRRTEDKKGSP